MSMNLRLFQSALIMNKDRTDSSAVSTHLQGTKNIQRQFFEAQVLQVAIKIIDHVDGP